MNPAHPPPSGETLRRLLRLALPFWRGILLASLLGFATIASSVGLMTTSAYIIARAALRPSIAELQVAIVGVRFFGIARGLFRYLERNLSHDLNLRLLARLRTWFYRALEPLAPARLLQYRSGDLLSRIVADIEALENLYVRVIAPPLVALMIGAMMWLLMGSFAPSLALALLLALALAGIGLPLLTRRLGRDAAQRLVRLRADMNAALVDGIQGMADLLAFGQEPGYRRRLNRLSQELFRLQDRMARITGLHTALSGLLMDLAVLGVLVIALPLLRAGQLPGVSLAVLVLAVISSFEAVLPLPLAFQYLETSLTAGQRLFEIVDAEPAVAEPPRPGTLARQAPLEPLEVRNLSFHYAPDQPAAILDLSFTLPPGGRIAIVGPSGAGKTTLVNLLLRFWDYSQGQILLGSRDIRQLSPDHWRRLIAVVAQATHLFNATVRENLLMALPEPAASPPDPNSSQEASFLTAGPCPPACQRQLETAAQQARIHDLIQSLPQRYDTQIGEEGLRLSGGERQRLAIARAILQDAPLLLLDEPTANLDTIAAREIMNELQSLMAGRSTLLITHRLLGLEFMDEILVMHRGRIVERGQHHDLLQMGGLYHQLWEQERGILPSRFPAPPSPPGR